MFPRNAEAEDGPFLQGATVAAGAVLAWVDCLLADGRSFCQTTYWIAHFSNESLPSAGRSAIRCHIPPAQHMPDRLPLQPMTPDLIVYDFELPDATTWSFQVDLNRRQPSAFIPASDPGAPPPWTGLAFHRCENCPLAAAQPYCPPAVDAAPILEKFSHVPSTVRMKVTVRTAARVCTKETDAQMGLEALLALVMATSACPILGRLRSQALFHLPFASVDETLYRTVGDYLIKQFFVMKDSGQPDFALAGLEALYRELAALNNCFFSRIQAACAKDANLNAVVVLRSLSEIVSMSLDERLAPLREAMQAMD